MAKIKVHELAKELELQSKDILSFLQEKGIEAKAAQSSLEEDAAALVRNSLGQKKATAAPAVARSSRYQPYQRPIPTSCKKTWKWLGDVHLWST